MFDLCYIKLQLRWRKKGLCVFAKPHGAIRLIELFAFDSHRQNHDQLGVAFFSFSGFLCAPRALAH